MNFLNWRYCIGLAIGVTIAVTAGYAVQSERRAGRLNTWLAEAGFTQFPPAESSKTHEEIQFLRLRNQPLNIDRGFSPHFQAILKSATGYDAIVPDWESRWISTQPYLKDAILTATEIKIRYARPAVTVRNLFLEAESPNGNLIIILPGFNSSAAKVLGLDNTDFHNGVGLALWRKGYDVAVPDLVSSPELAAAINVRLTMAGYQLSGLQARQTCDLAKWLGQTRTYKKVVFYGVHMGGRLAEFVANLCDAQADWTIIDGTPQPWRDAIWRNVWQRNFDQPQALMYLGPLLSETSFSDFVREPLIRSVYLLDNESYATASDILKSNFRLSPIQSGGRTKSSIIVPERDKSAPPNADVIQAIVEGRISDLGGLSLTPLNP